MRWLGSDCSRLRVHECHHIANRLHPAIQRIGAAGAHVTARALGDRERCVIDGVVTEFKVLAEAVGRPERKDAVTVTAGGSELFPHASE
jgi:hypothetical protein